MNWRPPGGHEGSRRTPWCSTISAALSCRRVLVPDGVTDREAVARLCQRQQAALDAELDQRLVVEPWPRFLEVALGEELLRERGSQPGIVELRDPSGHVEGVVLPRRRKGLRMERVPGVTAEVGQLGSGDDERIETVGGDQRADRMDTRSTICAHGAEECKADVELEEERGAEPRQLGTSVCELLPSEHAGRVPDRIRVRKCRGRARHAGDAGSE